MLSARGHLGVTYTVSEDPPRRGGMSEVRRAISDDGRVVALKIALEGRDYRARLERERTTYERLRARRPDLERWSVVLLDYGNLDDGRPFLVLPWHTHTLRTWLEERPKLTAVFRALADAATAVAEFHHSGPDAGTPLLHRDVKPDNFLVSHDPDHGWTCRLGDLGGARAEPLSAADQPSVVYTPGFAPVEQTLPLRRPPDPSVDVYAMAATVVHVLTGHSPDSCRAPPLLLPEGRRLGALGRMGPGGHAEREELRRLPVSSLVALDRMESLTAGDVARLRWAMGRTATPATIDRVIDALREPLQRALHPDPDRRDRDTRRLVAACLRAVTLLGANDAEATLEPSNDAAPAPSQPPASPGSTFSPPSASPSRPAVRWRGAAAATGGVALLGITVALWAGSDGPPVVELTSPLVADVHADVHADVVVSYPGPPSPLRVSMEGAPFKSFGQTGHPLRLSAGVYSVVVLGDGGETKCEARIQVRATSAGTEVLGASWSAWDVQRVAADRPASFVCSAPCPGCLGDWGVASPTP